MKAERKEYPLSHSPVHHLLPNSLLSCAKSLGSEEVASVSQRLRRSFLFLAVIVICETLHLHSAGSSRGYLRDGGTGCKLGSSGKEGRAAGRERR